MLYQLYLNQKQHGLQAMQLLNADNFLVDMDIHLLVDLAGFLLIVISILLGKETIICYFNKLPNIFLNALLLRKNVV